MNTKRYNSRAKFWASLHLAILACFLFAVFAVSGHILAGLVLFTLVACSLNRPQARACSVTLSVPEILMDVLDAFKLETPQLFQPGGFGTDFSSKTAVLGDKVTAKISHVPVVGNYDANNGGFKAAQQDVTTLIEDVPVTLNQFKIVTVNVTWLTQLASKIELYKEAVRNYGYALGKYVVDTCLAQVNAANFSNKVTVPLANVNLDTWDGNIRSQLNLQKTAARGRYAIINTPHASQLGTDDRVRSSLFYGALNGDRGYRQWNNLAGFNRIVEYPDMYNGGDGNLIGFAGDPRAIVVATRQLDFSNAADQLGVPKVQEFYPMVDELSGIHMTGTAWQEVGTGNVLIGCGLLFGVSAGNQGGAAGTITDNAGVRIVVAGA
jgi:hypothetical protein